LHVNSLVLAPLLALLLTWTGIRPADLPAARALDTGATPHLVPAGQALAQVPEPGTHPELGTRAGAGSSRPPAALGAHDARATVSRARARLLATVAADCHGGALPRYFASLPPPR